MKRIVSIGFICSLLAGCGMHSNDPRAPHYRASVTTIADNVCVMVQPQEDERISHILITEVGNSESLLSYDDLLPASSDKCIPTFDYKFEVGRNYSFDITLESPSKKKQGIQPYARIYGVSFTLWNNSGKLEATPL